MNGARLSPSLLLRRHQPLEVLGGVGPVVGLTRLDHRPPAGVDDLREAAQRLGVHRRVLDAVPEQVEELAELARQLLVARLRDLVPGARAFAAALGRDPLLGLRHW